MLFVAGRPKAILDWLDMGAGRSPVCLCELEPCQLKGPRWGTGVFFYEGETEDPRFAELKPRSGEKNP